MGGHILSLLRTYNLAECSIFRHRNAPYLCSQIPSGPKCHGTNKRDYFARCSREDDFSTLSKGIGCGIRGSSVDSSAAALNLGPTGSQRHDRSSLFFFFPYLQSDRSDLSSVIRTVFFFAVSQRTRSSMLAKAAGRVA